MSACLTGCDKERVAPDTLFCATCEALWEKSPEHAREQMQADVGIGGPGAGERALMDVANRVRAERAAKKGTP